MSFPPALSLEELLNTAGSFYPNWDQKLADRLFDYFAFNPHIRHGNLSKGMKSTYDMIVRFSSQMPAYHF